ncbi:hypothetical protein BGZ76_004854 [Entomortierella beljakovae]|nr:hypothetical protein BGZ76_004854 [Entomortierella beljakovae]
MRFTTQFIAAVSLSLLGTYSVQGYGILGHTLTGQVAQLFLTPETAKQVKEILSPYYGGLLSKAAPWPDTIKGQARYRWASVYHYVNSPGDNPPDTCNFKYVYAGKDVVNGLFNMTSQLHQFKQQEHLTPEEKSVREDALRFFVHFMGDIHQPLHASGKERGGNNAPARWRRAKTSLHRIWDGQLIVKDIKVRFDDDPKAYLDNMIEMTNTIWQTEAANWTFCNPEMNAVDNPWSDVTNQITTLCPLEWAKTMNQFDCTHVWYDYDPSRDYSLEYFDKVTGEESDYLVQKLITMSGIRMAAILNEIYDPPKPAFDNLRFVRQ